MSSTGPIERYEVGERSSPRGVSDRSRRVALVLSVVLGFAGGHQFYAGKSQTGILMALTLGGAGLWWLYDIILVAAGEFRDAQGRRIWRWSAGESEGTGGRDRTGAMTAREFEQLTEQLDALRSEVGELAERVDFAERLLSRGKEREGLLEGDKGRR